MAERGNAWIEVVTASHASMVSQPEAVTRLILSALEETSRSSREGPLDVTLTAWHTFGALSLSQSFWRRGWSRRRF